MNKISIKIIFVFFILFICFQPVIFADSHTIHKTVTDPNTGIITYTQESWTNTAGHEEGRKLQIPIPPNKKAYLTVSLDQLYNWANYAYTSFEHGSTVLASTKTNWTWNGMVYDNNYFIYTYAHKTTILGDAKAWATVKIYPYFNLDISVTNQDAGNVYINGEPYQIINDLEYQAGTKLTLKAEPAPDFKFVRWEGSVSSTAPTINITMNEDKTIRAVFEDNFVADVTNASVIYNERAVQINWQGVTDPSGIKEYQIMITESEEAPTDLDGLLTTDATSIVLTDLSSRTRYYAWIRAVDNAGNISKNWLRTDYFSPYPENSQIIACLPRAKEEDGKPCYEVELTIKLADADRFVIQRSRIGTDEWREFVFTYEELSAREFTYTDVDNLMKHGHYQYKIFTLNAIGAKSNEVFYDHAVVIPNIVSYQISGPQHRLVTNKTEHHFDLNPKIDVEGDEIRFRVLFESKTTGNTYPSSVDLQTNPVNFVFPAEGEWEWSFEIAEYDNGTIVSESKRTTEPQTLFIDYTPPLGGFRFKSLANEKLTTHTNNLNLKLDHLQVGDTAGSFNSGVAGIYLWNGEDRPTSFADIALSQLPDAVDENILSALALGEKGIFIDFGSSIDHPLFDVTIQEIPWRLRETSDGLQIVSMEVMDNAGNAGIITENIIYDCTPPLVPTNLQLKGGRHQLSLTWDPAVEQGDPEVASGVKGYFLSYTRTGTGEEVNNLFIPQSTSPSYVITDLEDNEQITLSLKTLDNAGNLSDTELKGTGCSLAAKGEVNKITIIPTEYKAVLEIKEVKAAQYRIRRWKVVLGENGEENLVEQKDYEWVDYTNLSFIDENLSPHAKYYYSIITCNHSGEVDPDGELTKYAFVVPNQIPTTPQVIDFAYVNRIPVTLRTSGAYDTDGDQLIYCFTLKDEQGNILLEKVGANNPEDPNGLSYVVSSNLINSEQNGKTFTWQVGVTDGYMFDEAMNPVYIFSEEKQFTVDLSKPEIYFTPEDTSKYVVELELDFTVSDQISGLQRIEYYWSGETLPPEFSGVQVVTFNEGIKEHTFRITEGPEGTNLLNVTSWDQAGNEHTKTVLCRVDRTPPLLSNLKVIGREVNGQLYTTNAGSIAAEWELFEDYTNIDYFRYAVVSSEEVNYLESLPVERFTVVKEYFTRDKNRFAQVARVEGLKENKTYHFVLEAFNAVGLSTGLQISQGVTIDSQPPQIGEIFFEQVRVRQNKNYIHSINDLMVNVEISDGEGSGLKEINYALIDEELLQSSVSWFDSLDEMKKHVNPVDGKVYYFGIKAVDHLDQVNIAYSEPVIIDQTPPEIKEMIAGSKLEITGPGDVYAVRPGSLIPVSFLIEDEIILEKIEYSIGSKPGDNDISRELYPETNGWLTLDNLGKNQQLKIEENLPDGVYYINLQVENAAGLVTRRASNPVRVDQNLAVGPTVWDGGQYTAHQNELHFIWNFDEEHREVSAYEYRILEYSQGQTSTVIDWQRVVPQTQGESYQYVVTGLELANGKEYYIAVRGIYADGTISLEGMSDGIIVDTTLPEQVYIEDGNYTTSSQVHLRWGAMDPESGISSYQVQIGTTPGGNEITSWLALDQTGEGWIKDLPFLDSTVTYYCTLRVTNGAGLSREITSNGFRLDHTPPPMPIVLDEGRYIGVGKDETLELNFSWKWTELDPESGNAEYQVALLTSPEVGAMTEWQSLGIETSIVFTDGLQEGVWYYLAVRAINGAGLSTIGFSDGILIDTTAPTPPRIIDHRDYLEIDPSGLTSLSATFIASDDESDVACYVYSVGTLTDPDSIISGVRIENNQIITEPKALEVGKVYFFTVQAINNAGLISMESRSDGLMIIDGYPEIANVNDFGEYTSFNDQIVVAWDCQQTGHAPMAYYQIALSTDQQSWIPVKDVTEKQVVITPADLGWERFEDGETYYVSIRGVNKAGIRTPASEAGVTDGIKVDSSPPVVGDLRIIHPDQYTTNCLRFSLQASDADSGITAYKYAIGTTRGGTEVTKGWILNESSKEIYDVELNLELEHNVTYYITFQARNGTRLWSQPVSDQGVIADLTPPQIIVVNCDNYINSTQRINLFWRANDPETGITGYRYYLGEENTIPDWSKLPVFEITSNECTTQIPVADDLIIEGAQYFLALQVRNRLGIWSSTSRCDLVVDTVSPSISLDAMGEIVTNDGVAEVHWTVSEPAVVNLELFKEISGDELELISESLVSVDESTLTQIYSFNRTGFEPARYRLVLTAIDRAGNEGLSVNQALRVNAKPQVELEEDVYVYKGRELDMSEITISVSDTDGEIISYEWDFGDGYTSTEVNPKHIYNDTGEYKVTLTCTDNDGGVGTDTIIVTVTNTFSGSLVYDETWAGRIELSDTVIVPAGVKLTIGPGTIVEVPPDKELVIDGTLEINGLTDEEVYFTVGAKYPMGSKWKGLRINPGTEQVKINNTRITRAERGITVIERDACFEGLELAENTVGLHLYHASPTIINSKIINNELYGIKEDEECTPVLIDNYFFNNLAGDYYDSELTILSPAKLEGINDGN